MRAPSKIPLDSRHQLCRAPRSSSVPDEPSTSLRPGSVRETTGNDDYKFGDVTKNAMKGLFGMMEKGAAAAKKKIEDADK